MYTLSVVIHFLFCYADNGMEDSTVACYTKLYAEGLDGVHCVEALERHEVPGQCRGVHTAKYRCVLAHVGRGGRRASRFGTHALNSCRERQSPVVPQLQSYRHHLQILWRSRIVRLERPHVAVPTNLR